VWVYAIDQTRAQLTLVTAQPVPVGSGAHSTSIYTAADSYILYVTNSGDGTVSAFTLNPNNGTLTPLPGSPFRAGQGPSAIVTVERPQVPG
jgi:DNA-binding beta-propeller fold protein YncE